MAKTTKKFTGKLGKLRKIIMEELPFFLLGVPSIILSVIFIIILIVGIYNNRNNTYVYKVYQTENKEEFNEFLNSIESRKVEEITVDGNVYTVTYLELKPDGLGEECEARELPETT
jgi:hypothetical protein